jgi:hypothetical protein
VKTTGCGKALTRAVASAREVILSKKLKPRFKPVWYQ